MKRRHFAWASKSWPRERKIERDSNFKRYSLKRAKLHDDTIWSLSNQRLTFDLMRDTTAFYEVFCDWKFDQIKIVLCDWVKCAMKNSIALRLLHLLVWIALLSLHSVNKIVEKWPNKWSCDQCKQRYFHTHAGAIYSPNQMSRCSSIRQCSHSSFIHCIHTVNLWKALEIITIVQLWCKWTSFLSLSHTEFWSVCMSILFASMRLEHLLSFYGF